MIDVINYIYNCYTLHINPPLDLIIPPNLSLTLPISHLLQNCFAKQHENNKYIILIFYASLFVWIIVANL